MIGNTTQNYNITYEDITGLLHTYTTPHNSFEYSYDSFDRLTRKLGGKHSIQYTYVNGTQRVDTYTISQATAQQTVYAYTYDNLGNITSVKKNGTTVSNYEYDKLGRLIREDDCANSTAWVYTYDNAGNLLKKYTFYGLANGIPAAHLLSLHPYNGSEISATYTYSASEWGDLLTNYNSTTITYDAIGNPLKWRNAINMTWDNRALQHVRLTNGNSVAYQYNADGIRTKKTYSTYTHDYILDGSTILKETIKNGNTTTTLYYYYDESGISGVSYNGTKYSYVRNLQGDVIAILNSNGATMVEYEYDAWGNILSVTGSMASNLGAINPFRYRGYYYDTETGFYYLNSRYYDPQVGRFLNIDSIIGANGGIMGYNMFAYCNNNPVMLVDPSGMCAWGDMYWTKEFAPHTLFAGDVCPVCHKIVDDAYIKDPWGWTELQQAHPEWTGAEVSQALKCRTVHVEAQYAAKTYGNSKREREKIYQEKVINALCFVAGTLIKAEDGDTAIEDIQVGDYVWAHNPETNETELRRVVQTFENQTTELVIVRIGEEIIETTPEHPFYVLNCNEPRVNTTGLGSGWVKAKDLRSGDELLLLDGRTITIQSVAIKHLKESITVYNFEVEYFHTYFVAKAGTLVHNQCFNADQAALHKLVVDAQKTGVTESDALILWGWAQEYGFRGHGPRYDSYQNGEVYHIKIYGKHINIH